jgi:16S rRNA (cytosine1402-N4)-methyltransferase
MQLAETGRGFSFQYDAPLDMRFSPDQKLTAAEIVNTWSETEIAGILYRYGEERRSRVIARRIVESRPLKTTTQLAKLVAGAIGHSGSIHPATRTFQALRIAVNDELARLEDTLDQSVRLLGYSGRLVVIAYHSLEDRIVKQFFQREATDCVCPVELPECRCGHVARLRVLNRKVMTPTDEEVRANPRARSARLRAAERILSRPENEELPRKDFFLNKADYNVTDRHCLEAGIPNPCTPGVTPLKGRSAM